MSLLSVKSSVPLAITDVTLAASVVAGGWRLWEGTLLVSVESSEPLAWRETMLTSASVYEYKCTVVAPLRLPLLPYTSTRAPLWLLSVDGHMLLLASYQEESSAQSFRSLICSSC